MHLVQAGPSSAHANRRLKHRKCECGANGEGENLGRRWVPPFLPPSSPPLPSVMFWFPDIHTAPVVASHHLRSSSRLQVWWAKVKGLRPYMCIRWWYFVFKGWSPVILDWNSSSSLCSSQVPARTWKSFQNKKERSRFDHVMHKQTFIFFHLDTLNLQACPPRAQDPSM